MDKIYETYGKIYEEIIPSTSYIPIKDIILHFEKYDYRFHWNSDNSVIEIWIPIQDQKQFYIHTHKAVSLRIDCFFYTDF